MGLLLLMGDAGTPFTGALDTLGTGLESAWSVGRRLRAGYNGNIIRVRRSSDNTESDFGYLANGNVNAAAIASFCGAGDGFLTTVYDQSGNARNLTQSNTAIQPIICESGTVVTQGGKPAAKFVAADSRVMSVATSTALYNFLHTTGGSVSAVMLANNTAGSKTILSSKTSFSAAGCTLAIDANEFVDVNIGRLDVAGVATSGNSVILTGNVAITTHHVMFYNLDADNGTAGSRALVWRNGTAVSQTNAQTGTPFVENAANNLTIGARVSNNYFDGVIQEVVIWSAVQSDANRDSYESNAGTYYGITVA